jgi:hypothetical protein
MIPSPECATKNQSKCGQIQPETLAPVQYQFFFLLILGPIDDDDDSDGAAKENEDEKEVQEEVEVEEEKEGDDKNSKYLAVSWLFTIVAGMAESLLLLFAIMSLSWTKELAKSDIEKLRASWSSCSWRWGWCSGSGTGWYWHCCCSLSYFLS